jgi:anti-sigma regulatory factor (Ser/Thr protein kinase)
LNALCKITKPMFASRATVGLCRSMVAETLRAWGCAELVDDALIVVSELATNAVAVSGSLGRIALLLDKEAGGLVRIGVWDGAPGERPLAPMAPAVDLEDGNYDDNHGWGLAIVGSLARKVGCDPLLGGKVVWAILG